MAIKTTTAERRQRADAACPNGWTLVKLAELIEEHTERAGDRDFTVFSCSKISGIILQSQKFHRRIASANISRYKVVHPRMFVYDPMLLWDGSIGRNDYPFPGIVSPAYSVFSVAENVDSDFLAFLLRSPSMIPDYIRISEGTNVRRRKAKFHDFGKIEVCLPPISEQRAIARIIRSIQHAQVSSERVIDASLGLRTSLMCHLFTHGPVPVARSSQVLLKETDIGPIPAHWDIRPLADIATVRSGGTPKRNVAAYWGGNIPWIKTGEINYGTITAAEETITQEGLEKSSARLIPAGTLLMAMYGQGATRGRVAMLGIDAAINQACAAITPTESSVSSEFLYHYFTYSYDRIRSLGHGAHQKNLSAVLLKSIEVPIPPRHEQDLISEILSAVEQKRRAERTRLNALSALYKSLLYSLMSGEVRVFRDLEPLDGRL